MKAAAKSWTQLEVVQSSDMTQYAHRSKEEFGFAHDVEQWACPVEKGLIATC